MNFKWNFSIFKKDLKRTIAEGSMDLFDAEDLLAKCRLLLRSYSKRNGDVGYCQGLNFIALEICKREFSNEVGINVKMKIFLNLGSILVFCFFNRECITFGLLY
jgi:hypothetical protein